MSVQQFSVNPLNVVLLALRGCRYPEDYRRIVTFFEDKVVEQTWIELEETDHDFICHLTDDEPEKYFKPLARIAETCLTRQDWRQMQAHWAEWQLTIAWNFMSDDFRQRIATWNCEDYGK